MALSGVFTCDQGNEAVRDSLASMLTVREVAYLLRSSVRTVYRLRSEGKVPMSVKIGGLVRWNRAELENWLQNGCILAKPAR